MTEEQWKLIEVILREDFASSNVEAGMRRVVSGIGIISDYPAVPGISFLLGAPDVVRLMQIVYQIGLEDHE